MKSFRKNHYAFLAMLALFSVLGGWIIYYATHWGPWAYSDSTAYIAAARSLIAGHGLGYRNPDGGFVPLTHYPPLYPWMLGMAGLLGADLVSAARWIDIILYGLLIFGLSGSIYIFTRSWFAAASPLLLLCSSVLLEVFTGAMSDAVCLFTGSLSLMVLILYLRSDRKSYLALAALIASLASLSRYIGVAYLITGGMVVLLLNSKPWKRRVGDLGFYGALGGLPLAIFLVWAYFQSHLLAGRGAAAETGLADRLGAYTSKVLAVLPTWIPYWSRQARLFPPQLKLGLTVAVFVVISVFALRKISQTQPGNLWKQDPVRLLVVFSLFILIYLVTLGFTYLFTTPFPDINDRILSPLHPAWIVVVLGLFALCTQAWSQRIWVKLAGILVLAVFLVYFYPGERDGVKALHDFGMGYTAKGWHNSPGLAELRRLNLPATTPIISNDPSLILFYFDVYPYELEKNYSWVSSPAQPFFGDGNDDLQMIFKKDRAALVLFTPKAYGDQDKLRFQQLTQGLTAAYQGEDMSIYYYPSKP